MTLAILCVLVAIGLLGYEVYYTSMNPDIYTGLGRGTWLAASAMVDLGASIMLYMVVRTLQAKRIITGDDRYKKDNKLGDKIRRTEV